jgi:uncharacterized protein (TIGR03086 family)
MDLRAYDQQALESTTAIVDRVTPDQLGLPSPCAGWTLADLLRHMVGNNNGFADAAHGLPADAAVWEGRDLAGDPSRAFAESAGRVTDAFAADDLFDRKLEVLGYGQVPGATAVGMHFIDYLVHGWDVARAIDVEYRLDEQLCLTVLTMGERWPQGSPSIWGPGAPFAQPVPVPDDAPTDHRMLAFLGRSPHWPN